MKIKEQENNDYPGHSLIKKIYKHLFDRKFIFLALLIIFVIGIIFGISVSGFLGIDIPVKSIAKEILLKTGTTNEVSGIISDTNIILSIFAHPINYFYGSMSNPDRMVIDIKNNDFQKLAYKREIALAEGILEKSEDDYVPAKITYNDKTVDVKLRLKGDWTDHLKGDKWSLRIKVKGDDTISGMKVFSIQDPKTRNNINEWLFQKAIERDDIVSLRYFFVDVTINGKNKGIYAVEENFDKRLIENNKYREGPIIKFNEELLWATLLKNGRLWDADFDRKMYFSSDIDAFDTGTFVENPASLEQFIKAKNLLESFRNGNLNTSEVFDSDKLAKFMAISLLMGAQHGTRWINSRFYYNPITSRLEPIGFDSLARDRLEDLPQSTDILLGEMHEQYLKNVLKDPIFFEKYVQQLERVSQKSYLDNLFVEIDNEFKTNIQIIHKDRPAYQFSNEIFYDNQNYINNMLNPLKGLNAYFDGYTMNRTIKLKVGNIQSIPIELLDVSYDSNIFEPKEKSNIIQGKASSEPMQYEEIEFMLPEGFIWSDQYIPDLKLKYKLFGHSIIRNESIFPYPLLSNDLFKKDFIRQKPNVKEFDFLIVNEDEKKIVIKQGSWELNTSLIIPENYTVIGYSPLKLDLKNNATILSYSPLEFIGSEDSPIIITSSDSSGQGIAVLNAKAPSILNSVFLSNLSAPSQNGWELSGSVTFYNSDAEIDNSQFSNNIFGDDMLNLVRSNYTIKNSLFKHVLFDAIDNDFATGSISQSSFVDIGNDAMDFSGSLVDISEVYVKGTGDKGVSAGEMSHINGSQIEFTNSNIAVASKDKSYVKLNNIIITSSNIGFTAYQKKPEFGPSQIDASSVYMANVTTPHLIEVGSNLILDNKKIVGTHKQLFEELYE